MFKSPKQHHLLDRTKKEGKERMKNDLYYAEDFKEGETFNLGIYNVTKEEIVDFAGDQRDQLTVIVDVEVLV